MPQKKARESIRRDLEKYLMYSFKDEYLKKSQELNAKYLVDRGKILRSIFETEYHGALDISEKEIKRLIERIGVVIYKRASPKEIPYVIIFTDLSGKITAINDAEKGSKILKTLFPGSVTVFAAVDPAPEKIKKKFKYLDHIVIGQNLEETWEKFDEILREMFPLED
ncbi:MAG: hypothetical protein ACP6IP_01160 [Candidatus Njordarchaeia archaeon]